ncbi:MAG: enoyl-CoA hydratase/isomerase family protein [Bauldia sp.]|nr:enoyl-CoA hydratase/isomerase family protein [Bauldia sp.]MCW5717380.1 enoyl-CoA hydratase/isomerase family protein [Bauldia sp.]
MSTTELVRIEVTGAVQTIRLERPEQMNALTTEMFDAISDALVLGEGNGRIRAFVLAGTAGAFTEGSDLTEYQEYVQSGAVTPASVRFLKTLATLDKPLIAAVDGPAIGIGTTMLLLCDYVVAGEWSVFIADQVGLGLPLDAASTLLGPRTLGHHFAFELLVAGEPFDAVRAHQAGLVNKVVAPGMVEEAARAVAEQIALRPPEAVRLAKRMMVGDRRDAVTRITSEASSFAALQNSPHASAALQERLKRGGF